MSAELTLIEIAGNYGALGLTLLYFMYDRQVLIPKLTKSLDRLSEQVSKCPKRYN